MYHDMDMKDVLRSSTSPRPRRVPALQQADLFTGYMASLVTLVFLAHFFLGTDSAPVYTIKSPDGDWIDCTNIYDQPAFKDPFLKNHQLQEYPTDMPKVEKKKQNWQVWHTTGKTCPAETIPIRRDSGVKGIFHKKYPKLHANTVQATRGHKYAIGYKKTPGKIFGTKVSLTVWDPVVESPNDFSLSQIWLASGSYATSDINTIEAGWQIYPEKYLDHQPRLFTFWTRDAYNTTRCYNTECAGFVHTSSKVALQAAIIRTSKIGGPQLDITLQIWKDTISGHWWLGIGMIDIEPVGYWPADIFTRLSDYADTVEWGGEVYYHNSSDTNEIIQMGSGEFADKGFRHAAYICNIQVAENNHTLLPVQDFEVIADYPHYYTIKKSNTRECGNHFYYGGPGSKSNAAIFRGSFSFIVFFVVYYLF